MDAERSRLSQLRARPWRKWGPYLSERQWGTVREDYSLNGDPWNYFPHDHARSRAYRWGEDGIAGICDDRQILCFALALWNGRDPILKERLFGLTNAEGNHGEDVKEYYYYLDNTPTHSYMRYLYKYPQAAFPYRQLIETSALRTRNDPEYELIDTGVFDGDRYFDVFVEYAKESPEDILVRITAWNRAPAPMQLHLLPTLWFRNQWAWRGAHERPKIERASTEWCALARAEDTQLGVRWLYCDVDPTLLYTENETNNQRLFGAANASAYVKDGINDYIVEGRNDAVNPDGQGTKMAAHYHATVRPGVPWVIRLRLSPDPPKHRSREEIFGRRFDEIIVARKREADEFYAALSPPGVGNEVAAIMRQALAGMLWNKQYYYYDIDRWLRDRGVKPFGPLRFSARNHDWRHMCSADIISMPDKWEYPWFATWDVAFHVVSLSLIDPDFAKSQLDLLLSDRYLHPSGQLPSCEWNFDDVSPPVHAWATMFTFRLFQESGLQRRWVEHAFQKLLLNFTWWTNRRDRSGRSVLEGGLIGLDNIGMLDRRTPLGGTHVEQADGAAWMALYAQNMFEISMVLLEHDGEYIEMVLKFLEHFLWIASAMGRIGPQEVKMWHDEDGFFYDVLRFGDGGAVPLKVRSLLGLVPLCAATVFDSGVAEEYPQATERFCRFLDAQPDLIANVHDLRKPGHSGRLLLAVLDEPRLRRVLARMLDESEFLSSYGIRSMSRYHAEHPYIFRVGDYEHRIAYAPGDADTEVFGGNANWRGPIWLPINAMVIRALLSYFRYYGDALRVECPTGSGRLMNLYEVAEEITRRLTCIFAPGPDRHRPVFGDIEKFSNDPYWRDYLPFYEFFNGDTGAGLGASHQTGWSGIIARLIHLFATTTADDWLRYEPESYLRRPFVDSFRRERSIIDRRHSVDRRRSSV